MSRSLIALWRVESGRPHFFLTLLLFLAGFLAKVRLFFLTMGATRIALLLCACLAHAVVGVPLVPNDAFQDEPGYSGQKVARVAVSTDEHAKSLSSLVTEVFDNHVVPGRTVRVRATEDELRTLSDHGFDVDVRIHDLDEYLREFEERHGSHLTRVCFGLSSSCA